MGARSVLIVGAGPAGAALAYLLARRGVAGTLLEKYLDFARAFLGEGLQPSGVDALVQMGFAEKLGFIGQFVSQPALLEMLTKEAGRTADFQLEMGASKTSGSES